MPLEDPVDLFLVAPHHVPVIIKCLLPLSGSQCLNDAVLIIGFEFNVGGGVGVMLFLDVSSEVL